MPDHPTQWLSGLEPESDRRRGERRSAERRSGSLRPGMVSTRSGDRRTRQRRETIGEHLRNALQVLLHTSAGRQMPVEVRNDIGAAIRRVWLALKELERLPGTGERLSG